MEERDQISGKMSSISSERLSRDSEKREVFSIEHLTWDGKEGKSPYLMGR